MSYGYVLALAARAAERAAADHAGDPVRRRLSILDWGSGLGHYFIISRALLPDVTFDFTRAMCRCSARPDARLSPRSRSTTTTPMRSGHAATI